MLEWDPKGAQCVPHNCDAFLLHAKKRKREKKSEIEEVEPKIWDMFVFSPIQQHNKHTALAVDKA